MNLTGGALLAALAAFAQIGAAHAAGAGAGAAGFPPPAPEKTETPAPRAAIMSSGYPWSTIGRFNRRGGGHCTAVLAGERIAVTAAHCLWDNRASRMLRPREVTFSGGWNGARHTAQSKVRRIITAPRFSPARPARVASIANDWAIVILEKPLGLTFGAMSAEAVDARALNALNARGTVFIQAGYPAGGRRLMFAQTGCKIEGWVKGMDVIRHACETKSGDSGSPLFMVRDGEAVLIALHAAAGANARRGRNFAVPARRFAERLRMLENAGWAAGLALR